MYQIIIPARYHSKRFPGKVLALWKGKPLIQHVYETACQSQATDVYVASDDARILEMAQSFGAKIVMTSDHFKCGTERIAEAVDTLNFSSHQIVLNLQADELGLPPSFLDQTAQALAERKEASIATLCVPIQNIDDLFNPHVTKVVMSEAGYALYFSRAPIPWDRDHFHLPKEALRLNGPYYRHIGLYAYRVNFLKEYLATEMPFLEQAESLEQLRALWMGHKIYVKTVEADVSLGIDTVEDLARLSV